MEYHGAMHIVRTLPRHYQVVFAHYDPQGADAALASCAIKGPSRLRDFLEGAGVTPEVVKEIFEAIIKRGSHSVEGLKFSDADIDRLFPQVAQI